MLDLRDLAVLVGITAVGVLLVGQLYPRPIGRAGVGTLIGVGGTLLVVLGVLALEIVGRL